jgi:hypothetical protein
VALNQSRPTKKQKPTKLLVSIRKKGSRPAKGTRDFKKTRSLVFSCFFLLQKEGIKKKKRKKKEKKLGQIKPLLSHGEICTGPRAYMFQASNIDREC